MVARPDAKPRTSLCFLAEKIAVTEVRDESQDGVGKRVLVIDDEDLILQMIREVLSRNGYKVDVALDGEAAQRKRASPS